VEEIRQALPRNRESPRYIDSTSCLVYEAISRSRKRHTMVGRKLELRTDMLYSLFTDVIIRLEIRLIVCRSDRAVNA
jgi:hypothetical protein